MNEPGPYVTIGWSRPSTLCWLRTTSPLSITNMPGLTSPVVTRRSPARKTRLSPKRRSRSISAASRVGNI